MTSLRTGSATDVGLVRTNNQDRLLVSDEVLAVADGMGGAAAGEVASATAIEALQRRLGGVASITPEELVEAAGAANAAVWNLAEQNAEMRGMGTTLVALALTADDRIAVVNVGDSRAYALRAGELRQVTSDHSLVAELVGEGRLSKEEAEHHPRRNILTRSIGGAPEIPVDLFVEQAAAGDRYVLCSDGLPREVSDDRIGSILSRVPDAGDAARELVDEAKRRGGTDNITVVVVDVAGTGTEELPGGPAEPASRQAAPPAAGAADIGVPAHRGARGARGMARAVNLRVALFFVVLVGLIAASGVAVAWYGRSGYFVGLRGTRLVIFQGRPGGVLWIKPTVADQTGVTLSQVEPRHDQELRDGLEEPSRQAAEELVSSLVAEQEAAQAADRPPETSPPARASTKPTARTRTAGSRGPSTQRQP